MVRWLDAGRRLQGCDCQILDAAGNLSSIEWFRGIGEYKINYGAGWRIYLAKDGIELIVLLGGGSKSGQQGDIDRAVDLWTEYKREKAKLLKQV